jgi:uncharacterized protein
VQLIDGRPVYAATDLVGFLWCEHLTQLGRAALQGLVAKPSRDDPELELIRKRGFAHEKRYLEELDANGMAVTVIEPDSSETDQAVRLRQSVEATLAAMRRGDPVIYQAAFFDGTWRGHADFLRRVEGQSDLGPWAYEVADTKLARTAKAGALLQLCVYADLMRKVQGILPPTLEVALGGSARQVERFRTPEYMPFYERLRDRFLAAVAPSDPVAYPPVHTYPEPTEHCDVCAWVVECLHRRKEDDHLSLVAGMTRNQQQLLTQRGVNTMTALSRMPLPVVPRLKGTSNGAVERIREQARLQVEGREQHRVLFEMLSPIEAEHGLALLPPPSRGDLFFDMEGDPFVEDEGADGLEYLFGVIEPGDGLGLDPSFHAFWGLDRAQEKVAFESFIDLVMARRRADPNLHVYHYAAYEPTAVKRLMGRHATREDEVDELLRAGVFVDLFRVVKQGVRVSQDSYSIKKLEALYGFRREISLRDAGNSMVNFELWLDDQANKRDLLDLIRDYNRDDCVSNMRLRDWLEQRRASLEAAGTPVPRPGPRKGDAPPAVSEAQARVEALAARLTDRLPPPEERTNEQQATWLLAQLLDWFRREDKAYWWEYFHRLNDLTDEARIDDDGCIGGLVFQEIVGTVKRSELLRFTFPPQENDISAGSGVDDARTGKSPGTITLVDQVAGVLEMTRGLNRHDEPYPTSLIPSEYFKTEDQREALLRMGEWVAEHGIESEGAFQAGRDLLLHRAPRAGQEPGEALRRPAESTLQAARRLALALQDSTLAVQGPPGTGKTFQGARMIVELVRAGKRVGVTATGHKVIGNLLDEVARAADEEGVSVRIGQKPGREDDPTCSVATSYRDSDALLGALISREVNVAGGTPWVWSDPQFVNSVDVLFVDEAGQMSLANALAVTPAARSLVLLGDPQQLEQPRQGSHPPGAEASALQHLLGGAETIPDSLGLFLDRTWRMHPDLTRTTSELFYEDRLAAQEITAGQRLIGTDVLNGTGVRWIAVDHEGNENESVEEAAVLNELVRSLVGTKWIDRLGSRRTLSWENMLVVAPYNAQVAKIQELLPEARVGTVDKFQGQEAVVAFYSLTSSSPDLAPRGMEFLYSRNRLNVATSRAQCLAVIVGSERLLDPVVTTPHQVRLASALCRMWDLGTASMIKMEAAGIGP